MSAPASVVPIRRKADTSAAERQRRHREKQAALVTRDRTVPAVTLAAALWLAVVSGAFAVTGLTHIFAGAFWPIIGMGAAMEFGKLAGVTWLARRYAAPLAIKVAIIVLVTVLMALNAVGAYGFLAHAHINAAVTAEMPIATRTADVAARMQVQTAVVADIDRRIAQIDAAIDEATKRGRTVAAMALVTQETGRRRDLVAERISAANTLASLQIEAAQIDGDRTKIAADSGPVRYLAMLLGIADETTMRWFILAVALLLDPAAVVLLFAAAAVRKPHEKS
jgi:hypothetical protein